MNEQDCPTPICVYLYIAHRPFMDVVVVSNCVDHKYPLILLASITFGFTCNQQEIKQL